MARADLRWHLQFEVPSQITRQNLPHRDDRLGRTPTVAFR